MSTHHLILGETVDYITGQTITDTHDERARQKIARFLVEEKGYAGGDVRVTGQNSPLGWTGGTLEDIKRISVKPVQRRLGLAGQKR